MVPRFLLSVLVCLSDFFLTGGARTSDRSALMEPHFHVTSSLDECVKDAYFTAEQHTGSDDLHNLRGGALRKICQAYIGQGSHSLSISSINLLNIRLFILSLIPSILE